jgi:transcriptional regulator with XRE-family HTH domain
MTTRKPSRAKKGGPNAIDVHVGGRVRLRRAELGLSQDALAVQLGLTFQQVQKYERGINRIGAGRLYVLAETLRVPLTYFYEELAPSTVANVQRMTTRQGPGAEARAKELLDTRETTALVRAYYRIVDPAKRRKAMDILRILGREAA